MRGCEAIGSTCSRLSKPFELNSDGIVDTMAVQVAESTRALLGTYWFIPIQYFGHVIFTNCLLPLLKKTAAEPGSDVRIVVVGVLSFWLVKY